MNLSSLPWSSIGPVGLCAMFVVAILLGRLTPSAQVERLIKSKDDRIVELTRALVASQEREKVLSEQNLELMEVGRVAVQVMQALPPATRT